MAIQFLKVKITTWAECGTINPYSDQCCVVKIWSRWIEGTEALSTVYAPSYKPVLYYDSDLEVVDWDTTSKQYWIEHPTMPYLRTRNDLIKYQEYIQLNPITTTTLDLISEHIKKKDQLDNRSWLELIRVLDIFWD